MSINASTLLSEINSYTNYSYKGSSKIQLPYQWGGPGGVGKWLVSEITSNLQALGCDGKTTAQIQSIATSNPQKSGIDCSGFVLNVATNASSGAILSYFANIVYNVMGEKTFPYTGSQTSQLHYGVSAAVLTDLQYSTRIDLPENMQPGDFIRFDNGAHIGIIKSISQYIDYTGHTVSYIITYAHSSGSKGPHEATVSVPQGKALNAPEALWSDWDSSYSTTIRGLFNYVCRPKA